MGATIAALTEAAELPGVLDVRAAIPPTSTAFVRRVGTAWTTAATCGS